MCHLSAFRGCPSSEIIRINDCTIESSARGIEHDTCAICTTSNNQKIELCRTILQSLEMLVPCLHLEVVLDLLVFLESIEGFGVELSAQDRVN